MKKLAIITTHPIQYNAPVFQLLSERGKIEIKVFYTWEQAKEKIYDADFKREITWDIPLLEKYSYYFLKNSAVRPGLQSFNGIDNPTIVKDIKAFQPDALLVYGWNFKSHLKVLRYFKGKIPVIFRGDSTLLDDKGGLKSLLRKAFLSWIYIHVDIALYAGTNNKAYYSKFGLKENQLVFAPHAIDNDRFGKVLDSESVKNWRKELGIQEQQLVFLFAGKLEPKKDPLLLANAFRALNKQDVHLVVVGNGVLEDRLRKQFGSASNIHFLDFQNQLAMPSVYALADVYVLPSAGPGETWGLAVNEAMACGKAVLVSNKCGCAIDLVEDNVNGYVFESGNEDDLSDKLEILAMKSKDQLREMGAASFLKISKWNFKSICEAIEQTVNARFF